MAEPTHFVLLTTQWIARIHRIGAALDASRGDEQRLLAFSNEVTAIIDQLHLALPYRGQGWIDTLKAHLCDIQKKIDEHKTYSQGTNAGSTTGRLRPAYFLPSGQQGGRPKLYIEASYLDYAVNELHLGCAEIVAALAPLPVSAKTIRREILRQGLRLPNESTSTRSDLNDDELDTLVAYALSICNSSPFFIQGTLRSLDIYVSRSRVRQSLRRLRPIQQHLRSSHAIRRRTYNVKAPNLLWHNDGCHHLVEYGIVIHGFIDGHSRVVVGMEAANNNRADTVLRVFQKAVRVYGWPRRGRGDRGGENVEVAYELTMRWGADAYIFGISPHNTRIERYWLTLAPFTNKWLDRFDDLADNYGCYAGHKLNPDHLWLLHFLFLDEINAELEIFRLSKNDARLRDVQGRLNTPNLLFWTGMHQEGVRGLWQGEDTVDEREHGVEVEETSNLQEELQAEASSGVEVDEPLNPFLEPQAGRFAMVQAMSGKMTLPYVERWQTGLSCMNDLISQDQGR